MARMYSPRFTGCGDPYRSIQPVGCGHKSNFMTISIKHHNAYTINDQAGRAHGSEPWIHLGQKMRHFRYACSSAQGSTDLRSRKRCSFCNKLPATTNLP